MCVRILLAVLLSAAAVGLGAAPALAGAPNYSCRFSGLQIVADVHRDAAFVQEAKGRAVRPLVVRDSASGSGFTAVAGRERFTVKLLAARRGHLVRGARAELVRTTPVAHGGGRGRCTTVTGNHRAGWVANSGSVVRTAARSDAPPVTDTGSLPFVWSIPAPTTQSVPGWVAVRLWRADGRHIDGFLRQADVHFAD